MAAATLVAEVGNPFRFERESKFARWCGTGAVALSSGEGDGRPCVCPKLCRGWSGGVSVFVDEAVASGGSDDSRRCWVSATAHLGAVSEWRSLVEGAVGSVGVVVVGHRRDGRDGGGRGCGLLGRSTAGRVRGDPCEHHLSGGDVDEEQQVVGGAAGRPDWTARQANDASKRYKMQYTHLRIGAYLPWSMPTSEFRAPTGSDSTTQSPAEPSMPTILVKDGRQRRVASFKPFLRFLSRGESGRVSWTIQMSIQGSVDS